MAGHSHWAKIKRSKATTDARRGRVWSKLARRIIVAAKVGGGKPEENLQLRYAIDDARAANVPRDTIESAIRKGTGELSADNYEQVLYEAYAPGGVAVMVDCLTDNRNRTAAEIRNIFERAGGQLGATHCVAWMFSQKGVFGVPASAIEEDDLIELCLQAGAEDVVKEGDTFEVTCELAEFSGLKQALADRGVQTSSSGIEMIPNATVPLERDKARQVLRLMESLEEHEDVQNVYANFEVPDELAAGQESKT